MKVISYKVSVLKQKMSGKDLHGLIDNMGTLVANQNDTATEPNQNEFINELNYDYNHIGP
jgi:hypothetical protein